MVNLEISAVLQQVLAGNPSAMTLLRAADHESLLATQVANARPLVLRRDAAARVLRALIDRQITPELAQSWASFVRRGYVEGALADGPVTPVDIVFELEPEDAISQVVSRLDEIGDLVDGVVASDEAIDLLRRLYET